MHPKQCRLKQWVCRLLPARKAAVARRDETAQVAVFGPGLFRVSC